MVCSELCHRVQTYWIVMESLRVGIFGLMRILITILLVASSYLQMSAQLGVARSVDPASLGQGSILPLQGGRYQPLGNPAVLGMRGPTEVGAYVVQPFGLNDLAISYVHGAFHSGWGGLGAGIGYSGLNGFRSTTAHLAYGHALWNRLYAGLSLDGAFIDLSDYGHTSSIGLSGGVILPIREALRLGILIRYPFAITTQGKQDLPVSYQATLSYELNDALAVSVEWYQEEQFKPDFRLGVTYSPIPQVPIRLGYQSLLNQFSVGAGYRWKERLILDIAGGHHPFLGFTPSAGLRYTFLR